MVKTSSFPVYLTGGLKRFAKFGLVGASGVLVNSGLLYVLSEFGGVDYRLASLIAIESAICSNFVLNHLWTWRDRKVHRKRDVFRRFWRFNLSSGMVALVINWGLLVLLTELAGMSPHVANLFGIALGTVANYSASHLWAFGEVVHEKEKQSN